MDAIISRFKDETGIDISMDALAVSKLNEAVESAKISLSSRDEARIFVPFISADESGPKDLDFTFERDEFEGLISDYIDRSIGLCMQAISDGGLTPSDIEKFVLVGGSSRIPLVRKKLAAAFKRDIDCTQNPDEAVAWRERLSRPGLLTVK